MQASDGQIDYEGLVSEAMREAMRNVIRTVLTDVAANGLPGEHHFYISFSTTAPGVNISKRLKEKYPEEMTIVLQHRFWDLMVQQDRFEVKLAFNSIPERLVVPFAAVRVFVDPSVRFGHQFDDPEIEQDTAAADGDVVSPQFRNGQTRAAGSRLTANNTQRADKRRTTTKTKRQTDKAIEGADADASMPQTTAPAAPEPVADAVAAAQPPKPVPVSDSPKVVSLDQFRKK